MKGEEEEEEKVGGREVLALQRQEQYECRRVEEGGRGVHSTALYRPEKKKRKEKKRCSENPD